MGCCLARSSPAPTYCNTAEPVLGHLSEGKPVLLALQGGTGTPISFLMASCSSQPITRTDTPSPLESPQFWHLHPRPLGQKHLPCGPLLLFKAKCPPTFSATQSSQCQPAHPGPWWPQHPALRGGIPAVDREGAHPLCWWQPMAALEGLVGKVSTTTHLLLCPSHALWEPCADVLIVTQLYHTVAGDSAHPGYPTALSQNTGVFGAGTQWVSDPMSHSS